MQAKFVRAIQIGFAGAGIVFTLLREIGSAFTCFAFVGLFHIFARPERPADLQDKAENIVQQDSELHLALQVRGLIKRKEPRR